MSHCRVCHAETTEVFSHLVLNKYHVKYYQCTNCLFVQTEQPYWLTEAYSNAINTTDTGILERNSRFRAIVTFLLFTVWGKTKKYLDYAGGYGIFTRMMRDVGFDFFWLDPYANNLLSRGFEHKQNVSYAAITAFEVFEHLPEPIKEIEQMLHYSNSILFSTKLIGDVLPDKNWWYYGFNHGQHVALYHAKTLQFIATKFNLNYYTDQRELHLFTHKKINKQVLKLSFKLAKWGGYWLIKMFMKPKTVSDHYLLLNANGN